MAELVNVICVDPAENGLPGDCGIDMMHVPGPVPQLGDRVPVTVALKLPHPDSNLKEDNLKPVMPQSSSCKRFRYDSDSGAEDEQIKSPPKRQKKPSFIVKSKEMQAYFRLLDDTHIHDFLCLDSCKRISDKYLLAMVFAYFKRAGFTLREFTRTNFFLALYLANDMEEDEEDFKYEIFPWALGRKWKSKYMSFLRKRERLWSRISYRAVVSRKCCEEVMGIDPGHWAWTRERLEHHAGAARGYTRGEEEDGYPIGPDGTPRACRECDALIQYDSASPGEASWFLDSSSDSECDNVVPAMSVKVVPVHGSRFNMAGLKLTLQEENDSIWIRTAEE